MRKSADKTSNTPKKRNIFANVLATTALAATLASCGGELNEVRFDSKDNSVNFEMAFNGGEYVHYDVKIRKENDSTYYGLIDGGLLTKNKEYRGDSPDKVFEQVTDEICESVQEAQLSSREHIYELEAKAQNKIRDIQKEYKKMLDENDGVVKDSTIVYKP